MVSVCHTLALQNPQLRRRNDAFVRSVNTVKMHEYAENVKDHLSVRVEKVKVFAQNMGVVLSVNTASSDRIAGIVEDHLSVYVENVKMFAQNMGVVLSVSTVRCDDVVRNVKDHLQLSLQTKTRNGNFTKKCWIFTTRWKMVSVCHTLALQKPQLRRRNDAFVRSVNTAKMHEYAENVKDHLSVRVEKVKVFAQNMGVTKSC